MQESCGFILERVWEGATYFKIYVKKVEIAFMSPNGKISTNA